ncbi:MULTISPECIES: helix-turn-helix domain-containing protein [unclassified Microbacterium]|uniref:helix-turn-helix domain-containing protein n=1 Tax=unclassified Microbacterium TaxID=2609290 RepID=UPI0030104B99
MNYSTPSNQAARAIRLLLADKRETIEQLSDQTGIAHSTLKRRLLGVTPFTIDELHLIAKHFGVRITQVLRSPYETEDAA